MLLCYTLVILNAPHLVTSVGSIQMEKQINQTLEEVRRQNDIQRIQNLQNQVTSTLSTKALNTKQLLLDMGSEAREPLGGH